MASLSSWHLFGLSIAEGISQLGKVKCLVTFAQSVMRVVAHSAVFIELDQRRDGWRGEVVARNGSGQLFLVQAVRRGGW